MFDQIGQVISFLTAGAAVIYILGGFIVNLYLTQYGIVEYQVVQIKFLAVGLMYLSIDLFVNLFSYLLALLIGVALSLSPANANELLLYGLMYIPSLVAGGWLFFSAARKKTSRIKVRDEWRVLFLLGSIANIPNGYLLAHLLLDMNMPYSGKEILNMIVCGALAQVAMLLYYSRWLYGNRKDNFGILLLGRGAPTKIEIAGDTAQIGLLKDLGVPIRKRGITEPVYLIDETDTQYIIGIEKGEHLQPIKVMKKYVTALLYHVEESNGSVPGIKT